MTTKITPLKSEKNDVLAAFAEPIWYEHYSPIIGKQQVEYMLEKFQSSNAIKAQIKEGYQYYQVSCETQLVGYFSIQLRKDASLFISKFYLAKEARGQGLGKKMLTYIEELATAAKCKTLDLTVNKYNPAYKVYLNLGFINQGAAEFDIGNGYIMDDYLMSKPVFYR